MHGPDHGSGSRPTRPAGTGPGSSPTPTPAPGSLAGVRIVVTRARTQASGLARRLADLGATVVELPVIAIESPADGGAALAGAADRIAAGAYGWVVLTSSNAVDRLVVALDGRTPPAATRWAVVGTSTARALMARGIVPDLVPAVAVSDALVDVFPVARPPGTAPVRSAVEGTVLFVRAERARTVVAPGLAAKGWGVDEVVAYRTVAGEVDHSAVVAARAADAVAFTSSSTVERTVELLGVTGVPPVVACIGPVTSESARTAGLEVTVEAHEHTLDGLVAALTRAFADLR